MAEDQAEATSAGDEAAQIAQGEAEADADELRQAEKPSGGRGVSWRGSGQRGGGNRIITVHCPPRALRAGSTLCRRVKGTHLLHLLLAQPRHEAVTAGLSLGRHNRRDCSRATAQTSPASASQSPVLVGPCPALHLPALEPKSCPTRKTFRATPNALRPSAGPSPREATANDLCSARALPPRGT